MKKYPSKSNTGFTLIELLIVIVIIASLAALGVMAATKMLRSSRAAKCVGNLRQIGLLVTDIRIDGIDNGYNSAGFFPPYAGKIHANNGLRDFNIYELIGEKAGYCEIPQQNDLKYAWSIHPSETFLQNPLSENKIYNTIKNPADITNANFTSAGGFSYNRLIEGEVSPDTPRKKVKLTSMPKIDYPSITILMAEQNPDHKGDPIWMGPESRYQPAGTYKDTAHCLMVDGHVEVLSNKLLASPEGMRKHLTLDAGRGDDPNE